MNAIHYVKNSRDLIYKSVVSWNPATIDQLLKGSSLQGLLYLINESSGKSLSPHLSIFQGKKVSVKLPKVQLRRALKLSGTLVSNAPKAVSARYQNIGAFKRSFIYFLEKHYKPSDPMCVVMIPDKIFDQYYKSKEIRDVIANSQFPPNLIQKQFKNDPILKKISKNIVGISHAIVHARASIFCHTKSSTPVLIVGETGSGKKLIARQIFIHSSKYNKEFYRVVCALYQQKDFEVEMLGYEEGVFTKALKSHEGLFVKMNRGTLYFDEIADLSLVNQRILSNFIRTKEVTPVGAINSIRSDVRIIAATCHDLETLVKQGKFRNDLYFLFREHKIKTVSLRESPEDIPVLASFFWGNELHMDTKLSDEVMAYLMTKKWPGNALQLRCFIESIIDYFPDTVPTVEHFKILEKIEKDNRAPLPSAENFTEEELNQVNWIKHLVHTQNIIREIKVELRPLVNNIQEVMNDLDKVEMIRNFVNERLQELDDLCRHPILFRSFDLYENTRRFRFALEQGLLDWPKKLPSFREIWYENLQAYYKSIFEEIFELVWRPHYKPRIKKNIEKVRKIAPLSKAKRNIG